MKPHLETGTHTPGPWLIKKRHDEPEYSNSILSVEADGKDFVDSVATLYGCEDPEKLANARLIAAAPELLQALQNLVSDIDDGTVYGQRLAQAHAAIANATGKTK